MALFRRSLLVAIALGLVLTIGTAFGQSNLTIQGDRWLTITQLDGPVELVAAGGSKRAARRGDRLTSVGDTLTTGTDASARLEVDQATGFVTMAENSQLRVQALSITSNGGRVTELAVTRGQVRLRVRPLTNPASRLEIHTPAGVSGVRGTDFGVTVQPNGRTGVATEEGSVFASAQGETVNVGSQLQSTINPGEPPTPPVPLRNDPSLFVRVLSPIRGQQAVRLAGHTDSVNLLKINGELQALGREGEFDQVIALDGGRRITALVTTPLGTEQRYELVVP